MTVSSTHAPSQPAGSLLLVTVDTHPEAPAAAVIPGEGALAGAVMLSLRKGLLLERDVRLLEELFADYLLIPAPGSTQCPRPHRRSDGGDPEDG